MASKKTTGTQAVYRSSEPCPGTSSTNKRISGIEIEQQHNLNIKKAKQVSSTDQELKYKCSFCQERYPTLTMIRDHTRANHREENEKRKEKKLNSTKVTTVLDRNMEPKLGAKSYHITGSKQTILFKCIACAFGSISYDSMIEHCQHHMIKSEYLGLTLPIKLSRKLVICNIEFDVDFDTYNELQDGSTVCTFIDCDYKLLKQDRWPALFVEMPKSEIDKINVNSIYYFTRVTRLISRRKPSIAPFMVFQCGKCMKYVDTQSLLSHVTENSCNEKLPFFACSDCERPFLNENTMALHCQMHKSAVNSNMQFRTVLFNNRDDDLYNALLLKIVGFTMQNLPPGYAKTIAQPKLSDVTEAPNKIISHMENIRNADNIVKYAYAPLPASTALTSDTAKQMQFKFLIVNNARSMIIQPTTSVQNKTTSSEVTSSDCSVAKDDIDKLPTVYKCKCELCFHKLEFLFSHLENCNVETMARKINCVCGLLFDEQQYQFHYEMHTKGFTKLNVKKINMHDEKIVVLNKNLNEDEENKMKELEYDLLCRKAISELIATIRRFASQGGFKTLGEKQKLSAAASTRTVGSGSDNVTAVKSQGTMTVPEIPTINKVVKATETKSVGTGTNFNTPVMISQGTMTPEANKVGNVKHASVTKPSIGTQTSKAVHKDASNMTQGSETKSIAIGTDDLNNSMFKYQRKMTTIGTQTNETVNTDAGDMTARQSKSVRSGTDDLKMSLLNFPETMTIPSHQIVYKDVGRDVPFSRTFVEWFEPGIIPNQGIGYVREENEAKCIEYKTKKFNDMCKFHSSHIFPEKSKSTATISKIPTTHECNKHLDNVKEGTTKSRIWTVEDYNLPLLNYYGSQRAESEIHKIPEQPKSTATIPNIPTTHECNKDLDNAKEGTTKSRILIGKDYHCPLSNYLASQRAESKIYRIPEKPEIPVAISKIPTFCDSHKKIYNVKEGTTKQRILTTMDCCLPLLNHRSAMGNQHSQSKVNNIGEYFKQLCTEVEELSANVNTDDKKVSVNVQSDNTDENQCMVETTMEVEAKDISVSGTIRVECDKESISDSKGNSNISVTKPEDHKTTKESDQLQKTQNIVDPMEGQTEKNESETVKTHQSENNKDVVHQSTAGSKLYTEDELLNNPDMPIYFDADESVLTDDEDPILHEDDDVLI